MISSNLKWVDEHAIELKDKTLVTLSMEGYIPELTGDAREANTRGGLGIYFGDKLEGLKAIGMDQAFGCMPLYQQRLMQSIKNGKQHLDYKEVSYEGQPIEPVLDDSGNQIEFDVWGWDVKNTARDVQHHVKVFTINRGGICLYLFHCPQVFDILYADDRTHHGFGREHRFLQETVFAECVYSFLKYKNIVPDILHLNEGHVAGAAGMIKGDEMFEKTAVVYTNHTVVPAGMERFCVNSLTGGDIARARYAMRFPWPSHQRFWSKFAVQQNDRWIIDFSKGAVEICDAANGVSNEHADVTQTLFPAYDRKIEGILNGSGDSWIMDELLEKSLDRNESSKKALYKIGAKGKTQALAEVKKRTAGMTDKNGKVISKRGVELDPDLPTIWIVRRIVQYKSQLPILKDIIHVICADRDEEVETLWGKMNGLEMQVVLGGITPEGCHEEKWIETFVSWMQRPDLNRRFVFVPNADSELLRMQAIGADICINCPMPEQEACGTSDQRSARNGGINIATVSGGPPEYIEDGKNGMLVGPYQNNDDFYSRGPKDILDKLRQLSDIYYDHSNGNSKWLDMKMESYLTSPKVSAAAMEQRYTNVYSKALRVRENIIRNMKLSRRKAPHIEKLSDFIYRLNEAARDFLYRDQSLGGWTVIAGSPYFDQRQGGQLYNWGRDTMIALPGLCIERERYDIFKEVVTNYLRFVKHGIVPNLVGDGSSPRYNSIDASLWLFWAMGQYLDRTKDYAFLDETVERKFPQNHTTSVRNIMEEIVNTFRNGIEFEDIWFEGDNKKSQKISIYMDKDFLIFAGSENTQLTWMDAKPHGGKPVTSRHGKAVEINALWHNALTVMANIHNQGDFETKEYSQLAEKVKNSFGKFWNEQSHCLYDTIDGDLEQGKKVRPNQVFAVALGLLDTDKSRAVINKVMQELLTPFGLRTLSRRDPDYHAVHHDEHSYHQGTVWPWLLGSFIEGCIVAYGKKRTQRILHGIGYFKTLLETLENFGSIPEVFDGGCDCVCKYGSGKGCRLQAWNVGESLRSLSLLMPKEGEPDEHPEKPGTKIIYEMVIRDYCDDENNESGLTVAQRELEFLAEAGVECIYLLGLMKHDGNPFDIMDPMDIDERAGSFEDLEKFTVAAHGFGIKIISDWLANQHVSKASQICKEHPDWFMYTDGENGDYYLNKDMKLCRGRDLKPKDKRLVLASATDEVPLRSFPRRWGSLAQPDLSHPEVRENAIEIGHFWLSKGLDGFRVDAALSTFPDKIKENWNLDVEDNLSRLFIQDMRKVNPDCFILFEGFERLEALLQLADYEQCAVYNWKPRNLTTDALKHPTKLAALIEYLKEVEENQHIQDELVSLGPEHDAFDFDDPWANLHYTERLLLNFVYSFLPGYMLVFNGQIFGMQHDYKKETDKTRRAPRVSDANKAKRKTGKTLFTMRKEYPLLSQGTYKLLDSGDQNLVLMARYNEKGIAIGVVNMNTEIKETDLPIDDIINKCIGISDIAHAHYEQDVLYLKKYAVGWAEEPRKTVPVKKLLKSGLHIEVPPKSCQLIRLHLK